jgi:ABC-2 type transport system ATP-binding protein
MIAVSEVCKSYGDVVALDAITLSIGPGITILLGPNGAGKTTLLRCLATVMLPDSGTIEICSIRAGSEAHNRHIRSSLGYMPQTAGFAPATSVERHLNRIAILKGIVDSDERRAAVVEAMRAADLTEYGRRRIRQLSGGMKRRLALAQALLGDPRVLLLDEPTAGLDPEQRAAFRTIIGGIGATGAAVLVSTHQPDDVIGISGAVVVLAGGRVLFQGSPRSLAEIARGHVWLGDEPPPMSISWPLADGHFRILGDAAIGVPVEPTIEDGYLILMRNSGANPQA